jgi:hypothetical protein
MILLYWLLNQIMAFILNVIIVSNHEYTYKFFSLLQQLADTLFQYL